VFGAEPILLDLGSDPIDPFVPADPGLYPYLVPVVDRVPFVALLMEDKESVLALDLEPVETLLVEVPPLTRELVDGFCVLALYDILWVCVIGAGELVRGEFPGVAILDIPPLGVAAALVPADLPYGALVFELFIRLPAFGGLFCAFPVGRANELDGAVDAGVDVPGPELLEPIEESGVRVFDEFDIVEALLVVLEVVDRVPVEDVLAELVPDVILRDLDLLAEPLEPLLDTLVFPDLEELDFLAPPVGPAAKAMCGVPNVAKANTRIKAVLFNMICSPLKSWFRIHDFGSW